jgi:hypothetical protein
MWGLGPALRKQIFKKKKKTRRPLKSSRLIKDVCAQKIGTQTLTIWARQNLQLLTSSKSG